MTKNIQYILSEYMERALESASYDKLSAGTFSGNIESCPGVVAFGKTLRECQSNLRSTLEEWILLGLKLGHKMPRIGGVDINQDRGRNGRSMAKRQKRVAKV
jgi:predicted RNase H-like HicB family nuclease